MKKLIELIKKARYCWICGNGGSSATAEHFTNDLFSQGIKAICLNSNTSIMTMIANDFGYEQVFSRQLYLYATPKDLLITLSCSGTSPDIVEVVRLAKDEGIPFYEFEKFSTDRNYGKLEDKHLKFAHRVAKNISNK